MAKRRKKTNANVPAKGRLKDMADRLWSLAVRADWNHRCAVCGRGNCDAHHLVPRQNQATRYDLRNGIALCKQCHQFAPDVSPHQNAAGWLTFLESDYPTVCDWYRANMRKPFLNMTTAQYYCDQIWRLKEYVEPEDFERIVGVRFAAWLEEQDEGMTEATKPKAQPKPPQDQRKVSRHLGRFPRPKG